MCETRQAVECAKAGDLAGVQPMYAAGGRSLAASEVPPSLPPDARLLLDLAVNRIDMQDLLRLFHYPRVDLQALPVYQAAQLAPQLLLDPTISLDALIDRRFPLRGGLFIDPAGRPTRLLREALDRADRPVLPTELVEALGRAIGNVRCETPAEDVARLGRLVFDRRGDVGDELLFRALSRVVAVHPEAPQGPW